MSFPFLQPYAGLGNSLQTAQAAGGAAAAGGWVELGRTTASGSSYSVSSLTDKRYYMILTDAIPSGNCETGYRLNGDTGSNYASRHSKNGSEGTTTSATDWHLYAEASPTQPNFTVSYLSNLSSKEKLHLGHNVFSTTGSGNAPGRREFAQKWANTSSVVNSLTVRDRGHTGSFASGETIVLGWDPADTHTTNFWEELASVTLGSDGDVLSSGTISAKKYLWVQAFIKNAGDTARYNTEITFNNDTGSNYSERRSLDGSADATSTSQSNIMNSGVTGSNDDLWYINMFIINNSANEKLCIGHGLDTYAGSGAGTAPSQRFEKVAKWANTSSQITEIDITNSDTSNYDAISELRVWGSD
jgi:hypothetical protein